MNKSSVEHLVGRYIEMKLSEQTKWVRIPPGVGGSVI